jgi:hypothetical protein
MIFRIIFYGYSDKFTYGIKQNLDWNQIKGALACPEYREGFFKSN